MPKSMPEQELQAISAAVHTGSGTATTQQIADSLGGAVPLRTLQYRLRHLVEAGVLEREGEGRWVRYRKRSSAPNTIANGQVSHSTSPSAPEPADLAAQAEDSRYTEMLSSKGLALHRFLQQRPAPRGQPSIRRRLLDTYRPNKTAYLGHRARARLASLGALAPGAEPPGTEVLRLGEAFEIDFTWNAARLSGSQYAELEVRRLIKFGRAADARDSIDTQAVLNYRDALRFLLGNPGEIAVDRFTLCNLHAILAHNLLPDEAEAGRLRAIEERFRNPRPVSGAVHGTTPGNTGGVSMDATFRHMTGLAQAIADPFEQAFFLLVQLPYLAPFAAMNGRAARLAVNIPLIRHNLAPISFAGVPADLFADALRGVTERSRIDLLKDVFLWAYERSAERYACAAAARGAPDPFRIEHDAELRQVVADVVRQRVSRAHVSTYLESWASARVQPDARARFLAIADRELRGLREGNFARYPVAAVEFRAWQALWLESPHA